ncbi:MAG: peptidoglycan binding domain-containing protein [Eubacterium sp.]|nr:peptidoglycan binding domain-containing protein [Eubacterium sp.]
MEAEALENEGKKKADSKWPKILKWTGIAIVAVLALVYIGGVIFYHGHYLANTTINGVEVSNMTPDRAMSIFEEEVSGYVLTLEERESSDETIKGTDISLEAQFDSGYDDVLSEQSEFAWPAALFSTHEEKVNKAVTFDEEKLEAVIDSLDVMNEDNWTESTNATLSEWDSTDGFTLVDGYYGTTVNRDAFISAVETALNGVQETLDMSSAGCYVDPVYNAESNKAQQMLLNANAYASTVIEYSFGSTTETVDGSLISEWLKVDYDEMTVEFDSSKVSDYVAELAEKYDTVGESKTLESSWGETVTIAAGTYGWKIDQEATAKKLKKYISTGTDYSGDVEYTQTAESHDGNDYGDTYVEVNISKQHLYLYVDGEQIVSTDFVSGKVSDGHATHLGAYYVAYKEKDATLEGQGYSTPVDYWMPFFDGQGLHDASWRYSFGGIIFITGGSHGCVNLPSSAAKKIFENIEAGIAVLIYDPDGVQTAAAAAYKKASSVISLIDAIGTVDENSGSAIDKARNAYDALSSTAKSYVSNYSTLTAAEKSYAKIQKSAKEVTKVINLISNIGEVTEDSGSAIKKARSAYNALSAKQKKKVTNYSKLTAAEKKYEKLTGSSEE